MYPAGSKHMANAKKATLSLVVKNPEVTSIDDVRAEFKEIGLEDIEPATMEAVCLSGIEALRAEFSKPYNRCEAARTNPDGVLNAVRCQGSCQKEKIYCSRHFRQDLAFKNDARKNEVVKFEEASTSETLSSSACSSLDGVSLWQPNVAKLKCLASLTFMSAADDAGKRYTTHRE